MGVTATNIDLPGLNVNAGLIAFGGDAKNYAELLRNFVTIHESDIEEAHRIFRSGDAQNAARIVHDIRGIADLLSAVNVARLAAITENILLSGEPATPSFRKLQVAMHTLMASILQFEIMIRNE